MRNKLSDLNNLLFEQVERLMDDSLTPDKFTAEVERAKAVSNIADKIINNGKLALDAIKTAREYDIARSDMPGLLDAPQA